MTFKRNRTLGLGFKYVLENENFVFYSGKHDDKLFFFYAWYDYCSKIATKEKHYEIWRR
jgi:hypothetical protein